VSRQYREKPSGNVFEIRGALAKIRITYLFVSIYDSIGYGANRPFGVDSPRPYLILELFDQSLVVEHEQMGVEDE
jgi:hypothetical protein